MDCLVRYAARIERVAALIAPHVVVHVLFFAVDLIDYGVQTISQVVQFFEYVGVVDDAALDDLSDRLL